MKIDIFPHILPRRYFAMKATLAACCGFAGRREIAWGRRDGADGIAPQEDMTCPLEPVPTI